MFASAFIVGPDDGPGLALEQLSEEVGFKEIFWFSEIGEVEEQSKRTPMCYFLFTSALSLELTQDIAQLARKSRNRQIKYAPLICFCETPVQRTIRSYLNMGFDDILIPPFSGEYVETRMKLLLGRKTVFYETDQYFGPDRRRMMGGTKDRGHAKRGDGGDHRRIELVRDANVGVKILKDKQFKTQPLRHSSPAARQNQHQDNRQTWDVA